MPLQALKLTREVLLVCLEEPELEKKKKKNRTSIIEWIHFQKHPHIRLKRRSTQNNLKVSGNEERSQLILEGLKVPTPQREHLQIFIYY